MLSYTWPFFGITNLIWWLTVLYIHSICYVITGGSPLGVFPAITISVLMAIAFVKYAN